MWVFSWRHLCDLVLNPLPHTADIGSAVTVGFLMTPQWAWFWETLFHIKYIEKLWDHESVHGFSFLQRNSKLSHRRNRDRAEHRYDVSFHEWLKVPSEYKPLDNSCSGMAFTLYEPSYACPEGAVSGKPSGRSYKEISCWLHEKT